MTNRQTVTAALRLRVAEAEATMQALLSGEVDAVLDPRDNSPVLLAFAQNALRQSEERYRSIVETANEGICQLERDGTIVFANERLAAMLGLTVAELMRRSFFDYVPERLRSTAKAWLARAPHGVPEESETALLLKTGRELVVIVRSSTIRDAAGSGVGLLAMITDATRRSEAEHALRESEAEYRQIVESTTDGIIKLDPSGTIVFVNARFSEMLGYAPQELGGCDVLSVVMESERGAVRKALRRRARGATTPTDTIYRHKNGSSIFVNIAGAALHDEHGHFTGILGVVRDMTERKRMQAELMVSDRMASVGTLAAGVAHEINNPLAAAMANLDYLREGVAVLEAERPTAERAEWLRARFVEPLADAQEAAERVRRIVRDLTTLSRSPATEQQWSVDVNAVLESSLRMARNEIRHRAELLKTLGDVPPVRANEARLGQVFLNLIVNAAQALPAGRVAQNQIRVATRRSGTNVVVEVGDTGAGIAPDNLERIFDAFYTTKTIGEGTGLGLAICRRIVSDIGGTLTVCSTLGVGSTFSVTIPMETALEAKPDTEQMSQAAVVTPQNTLAGRLLLIDDEDIVARCVQRSLATVYDFVRVSSAADAITLLESGATFDVILCDIMMPNVTGIDLYKRLVQTAPDQARRMMFMTGGAFTADASNFLAGSDVVMLAKPFGASELRAAVGRFASTLASRMD